MAAKTACVILAAGQGKRMRSSKVKVLHPICGEPMVAYPVSLAIAKGYAPVVVVVGSQSEAVREYLKDRFGDKVRFVLQEPPQGTGHAVMQARSALKGHKGKVAILYGDVPLLGRSDLAALEKAGRKAPVSFLTCRIENPSGYGRVLRDGDGRVESIVEHRDASRAERRIDEINTGIYLVDGPFLFSALAKLGRSNAQGEYYLTDVVARARQQGLDVFGVEVDRQSVLGVNDRLELAQVGLIMNRRLVDAMMMSGVSVLDPDHTYLGPFVRVGSDSELGPGCMLRGEVRVGKECVVGPGVVLTDCDIGKGSHVLAYSLIESSSVGKQCLVGPFARLRPGTRLGNHVRVGNFVETKKTTLGDGSKASHLSYLGDAEVGKDVNVGAGTITCNYDGHDKFTTHIGDGAFIGSDSQLVAPVSVGKNAYVGAGTTVTMDVPDGSLAISRAKQRHIQGYATRRNKVAKKFLGKKKA